MSDVNKVILVGRLGVDPERRETKNGNPVTSFSLATSHRTRKEAEGEEPAEETQWHKIVVWGKQGEVCAQYLKKGRTILVEGMLKSRKYLSKEGEERRSYEIHAESVSFLSRPDRNTNDGEARSA